MIKKTVFSNVQNNASFYIKDESEFFIKTSDTQYVEMGKGDDFIDIASVELPVFCDDYQMKVKPFINTPKKKLFF